MLHACKVQAATAIVESIVNACLSPFFKKIHHQMTRPSEAKECSFINFDLHFVQYKGLKIIFTSAVLL